MTSINPINVNTQGIGGFYGYGEKPKAEEKETKEAEVIVNSEKAQVSADKVLDLMAQKAISVAPKTINPAEYVDEASKMRIEEFMKGFENKVAEGLAAFELEFKGVEVSDSAKMAVVLAGIDKKEV